METHSDQGEAQLLFVCGDKSGAGKSSVCMGLLHCLLTQHGFRPEQLAYIKPATQCGDVQLVSKYCESVGIAHRGIGPVKFYPGLTAEAIDGKDEGVAKRQSKIKRAVQKIATGKRLVLVDGVGYPAVGSVVGISNAQVAQLLGAPVLVVGRPGVGDAIDSMNFILAYFQTFGVPVVGACWNRVGPKTTYHDFEKCRTYVSKYFRQHVPDFGVYGHLPAVDLEPSRVEAEVKVACYLREPKEALEASKEDKRNIEKLVSCFQDHFDVAALLKDLQALRQK